MQQDAHQEADRGAQGSALGGQQAGGQGLGPEDLARIARLSQLAIAPERLAEMASDLSRVLGLARTMGGEDVAKLPPLLSPLEARSETRADDGSGGVRLDRDEFFGLQEGSDAKSGSNGKRDGAFFKVPKVLGESGGAA